MFAGGFSSSNSFESESFAMTNFNCYFFFSIALNKVPNFEFIWIKDVYFWEGNIFTFVTLIIIPLYSHKAVFSTFSCYLNWIATSSTSEITISNKSKVWRRDGEKWKWFHSPMIHLKKKMEGNTFRQKALMSGSFQA